MRELNFEEYLGNVEYYNKKYKQTIKGGTDLADDSEEEADWDLQKSNVSFLIQIACGL